MNDNYIVGDAYICTFSSPRNGVGEINEDYSRRYCVLDKNNSYVIDIQSKLKYDYIETSSQIYLKTKISEKIIKNERAAIYFIKTNYLPDEYIDKSEIIIEDLKNGKKFIDGNEVLDNDEYLQYINGVNDFEEKIPKVKKISRKREK